MLSVVFVIASFTALVGITLIAVEVIMRPSWQMMK